MKTIALRFSDNYAPSEGVINLHKEVIDKKGYVWYGKFGNKISKDFIQELLKNEHPKFLLIKSGSVERYWVYFDKFLQDETPDKEFIPAYYRDQANDINCWFRILKFEKADKDILSKCVVVSSGVLLSNASKHSMNPYFKIEYKEGNDD
jgi:hypothetical protein